MPIRKDAAGYWHAEACVRRRRLHRRLPPGSTARDAQLILAELIRALHASTPAKAAVVPGDPLLVDLLADYSQRHALTLRSPDTAQHHAARIGRWCEGKRASQTRQVVNSIVEDMTGHYAPATINRSLGTLSKALSIAWQRGSVSQDYSTLVSRLAENNARTVSLTMAEVAHLAECASPPVRAAIWVSLLTGCRRGEVLAIEPHMIGRDSILLPAGNTKSDRAREVPIIPPLRPWLAMLPIPLKFEGLKSGFRRAREKAGMPHVHYHDLRRSCGTLLIREGVPLHIVSRILGHSSTAVTERVYAHLSSAQVQKGLDALTRLHTALTPGAEQKPKRRRLGAASG
jgi:integrase